jgi:hypothetical protein
MQRVIRNLVIAPLSRAIRRAVRGWIGDRGGPLEVLSEYGLYLLGWMVWPLDGLVRISLIARDHGAGPAPRRITVRGTPLLRSGADPDAASARARAILAEARALLEPIGFRFEVERVDATRLPDDVPIPACGLAALTGRFFAWASARAADPPRLTVYFVEDLGPLAGCAVPGADWLVADLSTDGTTVAHELGHLADLWRHEADPDNVMTDRPGGTHDRITPTQGAFLRSSRFAERVSPRSGTPGGS